MMLMFRSFFVLYFVKLLVGNGYSLEVCAIIILKPAGMLCMYQHETVMLNLKKNVDLHMKNILLKLKYEDVIANQEYPHTSFAVSGSDPSSFLVLA